jgi:hypothetical protein
MDTTKPQIKSGLIWRQVDENTVVVTPHSGKMRVLNGVGSTIWQLLADDQPLEAIVEHLAAHYEVSATQARTDLDQFLADLTERNLLHWGT